MRRKRSNGRPPDWLSRLDEIREKGDRRASIPLLEAFLAPGTDADRRAEIAVTLRILEDVRCAEPLRRAVLDTDLPVELRSLALEIHAAIPVDVPPRDEALAWARSSDVVTRAFGVRTLDVPDGEILVAAAHDPAPLVRYAAVEAMASITRTRPLVEAARRALGDDDAAIREAACRVALFDEPVDATHELSRALCDPSTAVRIAASDALEDFPGVAVLLALAEARDESDAGIAAGIAFEGVVSRVRSALAEMSPRARRRVERWSQPVRWLLSEPIDELSAGIEVALEEDDEDPEHEPVDLDEAARVLFDADAPASWQRRMLAMRNWAGAEAAGLDVLRECAASPNWSLRQGAAFALAGLRATDELVDLATDREPVVRRAAFEELRRLGEPRGLGAARDTLADPSMRPTAGDDAMALLVEVGRPAEAERTIVAELSRPDDRDGLWLGAIHLSRLHGIDAAAPCLRRIAEGPVTSSVLAHVAALAGLRDLGRRRSGIDLAHLDSIDHLDVQRALGEWDWHGARYG